MPQKKLNLEEVKAIELEILKHVKNVCHENNLRYFLYGGTLIGAVRHKGFIPWDDDIDLVLPREDYLKLVDILKNGNKYRSMSIYNNYDYYYSFSKVVDTDTALFETDLKRPINGYGVYIDLFPLDGLPQESRERHNFFKRLSKYRNRLYTSLSCKCPTSSSKWKYIFKYIYWRFIRILGWKRFIKDVEKLGTKYEYDNSEKVGRIVCGYGYEEIVNKSVFMECFELEFEGEKFPGPIGYDEYLTNVYGDYMQLPPIEQRVSHHRFEAYLKV